jgi:protein-S-isoprenylcysteine O-methyltransferase Ste14
MRSLVFVWPYAIAFWLIYIWAFTPEFAIVSRARRTVVENRAKDSGSLALILIATSLMLLLSFPLSFVTSLRFPAAANLPAFVIGTLVLVAGSLLRRHCWRVLGQYFTGDVQTRADQPVIDRGAYRWVRHPSYSAAILMFAGIGLALANWASLVPLVLVAILVYSYRARVEERALIQTQGQPYITYMKARKRFVPFIV